MTTVGIIGGGISGLSAAHFLLKGSTNAQIAKVILYEASDRLGGWLNTTRFEDGALYEHGPRSVRPVGLAAQTTLRLVEDLGLAGEILPITRSHDAAKNRLVFAEGKLHLLPNRLTDLFKVQPPFSQRLIRHIWREMRVPPSQLDDESVYDFFNRRFGEEIARYLADPLCIGIFAGDSRRLSIRSCFNVLFQMEQKHGSVVKGMLIPAGLQVQVQISSNGSTQLVDHVISTICAPQLAAILPEEWRTARELLAGISAVTVAVLNIEFAGNMITVPAFGYLVGSREKSALLGVIFDSCLFPQHNRRHETTTKLTCMLGGAFFLDLFGNVDLVSESTIVDAALRGLAQQMKITSLPLRYSLKIHKNCIPQYHVGHYRKVEQIENYVKERQLPLALIGSSFKGVAINDCVHGGRMEAERIIEQFN